MIFNPFERMVAFRYLRARRQEGFVSVIAVFSLLGIALGVAISRTRMSSSASASPSASASRQAARSP